MQPIEHEQAREYKAIILLYINKSVAYLFERKCFPHTLSSLIQLSPSVLLSSLAIANTIVSLILPLLLQEEFPYLPQYYSRSQEQKLGISYHIKMNKCLEPGENFEVK